MGERNIDTLSFAGGGYFQFVPAPIPHKYHEIYAALL